MLLPLFLVDLETSNGLMAAAKELMTLNRLLIVPGWSRERNAEHLGQFELARAEAQRVYGAAKESHNDCTRNTLKRSTLWRNPTCHLVALITFRPLRHPIS